MLTDSASLPFEIAARVALGRQHLEGKLVAAPGALQFFWRFRDRTFKLASGDMQLVALPYPDLASLTLHTTLRWFRPRLVLELSDPRPLSAVPGIQLGTATLLLPQPQATRQARTFLKMLDYHRSEALAQIHIDRLAPLAPPRGT